MKRILSYILFLALFNNIYAQKLDKKMVSEAKQWFKSKVWVSEGLQLEVHPSVDYVTFQKQYEANKDLWELAFGAIAGADKKLSGFAENGKFEIVKDRCYITISYYIPKDVTKTRLEGHQNYIDIQISTGTVLWGISTVDQSEVIVPYNSATDNTFYKSNNIKVIKQKASKPYIFIFFPDDLHVPSYADERVLYTEMLKKVVVKIEYVPMP